MIAESVSLGVLSLPKTLAIIGLVPYVVQLLAYNDSPTFQGLTD